MKFSCFLSTIAAWLLCFGLNAAQAESNSQCENLDESSKLSEPANCLVERLAKSKTAGLFSILEMCGAVPKSEASFWAELENQGWRAAKRSTANPFLTDAQASTPEEIAFITFILEGQSFEIERHIQPLGNYIKVGDQAVSALLDRDWDGLFTSNHTDLLLVKIRYDHMNRGDGPHGRL